jgi:NADPH:quinone reductase-like Zn-dependent oxidoreductase
LAINPVDWFKQAAGDLMFTWIKYPFVLGSDFAGEVADVGRGVTRFKVGDRVLGHALGMDPKVNRSSESAFQAFTVVPDHMAAPIPDTLSFESASVLPLGISTAACGLFQKDHLALQPPSIPPRPTGETVLIWGAATSVGSNAIQLAVAAGYEVVTTASPRNFAYAKALGASQVFDYNSPTVVADIVRALKDKTVAGALAIGSTAPEACVDVIHRCKGRKFVSLASFPVSFDSLPRRGSVLPRFLMMMPALAAYALRMAVKTRTRGIRTAFIFGSSLAFNEVGPMIYVDFLPRALAEGKYLAAPDPLVVGQGLEQVQAGFDRQRQGVSAAKVVVSLP